MDGHKHGLTGFEGAVYAYLNDIAGWISLKDLSCLVFGEYNENIPFHNTGARRTITKAIANINNSDEYDKLIIHGDKGVKIATAEEASRYIDARFKESLKQLKQTHKLAAKAGLHNQTQIIGETIKTFA